MYKLHIKPRLLTHDEHLAALREVHTCAGAPTIAYVDGKPVKREPLRFVVSCNAQPMGPRELMLVPEGDRYREAYVLRSVKRPDRPILSTGDKVLRRGAVLHVQSVADWGSYVEARAVKVDVGPDIAGAFDTAGVERWSLPTRPPDLCPRE